MIETVEQTNISRKKAKKKQAKVMHSGQTREEVWFESDIFLFSLFFQSNLSLIGTEASPFGGTPSVHMPTYLTDVDPPTMPFYLGTYCIRRYE